MALSQRTFVRSAVEEQAIQDGQICKLKPVTEIESL